MADATPEITRRRAAACRAGTTGWPRTPAIGAPYEEMASLWGQAEQVGALPGWLGDAPINRPRPDLRRAGEKALDAGGGPGDLAASLALVAVPKVRLWLAADHQAGVAELRDVVLEDGSRVALDAAGGDLGGICGHPEGAVTLLSGQRATSR